MGALYEFVGHARPSAGSDGFIANLIGESTRSAGTGATILHPAITVFPLVPCSTSDIPDWTLNRLSEDHFRLSLAAPGLTDDDFTVSLQGGLLRITGHRRRHPPAADAPGAAPEASGGMTDEVPPTLDCTFLLLEPLDVTGYEVSEGRLLVDLHRDHATPCRAELPPRLRAEAALALAA